MFFLNKGVVLTIPLYLYINNFEMKNILLTLLLFIGLLSKGQCTYDTPDPFPSSLTINSGDVLCVSSDLITPNTSLTVRDGGLVRIYNGSTFRVNGTMNVEPGGYVDFEDCDSKLEVYGTYGGGFNTCELRVFCDCSTATNPFTLIWGSKIYDEWCCIAPLPVELLNFNVTKLDGTLVKLDWSTGIEINNDYFEVQASYDGLHWITIDVVSGMGNTNTITNYTTTSSTDGIYFRLKQVDFDGTITYSNIRAISKSDNITFNLTTNYLTISNLNNQPIEIYNLQGQLVHSVNTNTPTISINKNIFKTGLYLIRVGEITKKVYIETK
jgi:hypothetical protein